MTLGSSWTRVGSRWRFVIPIRGLPAPCNQLRLTLQNHQPAAIEREAQLQYPGLRVHAERLAIAMFTSESGATLVPHHRPVLTPWVTPGVLRQVEAIPSMRLGAGDTCAEAFRKIRQHAKLAHLLPPKVLRAVLQAQPKVAQRILDACDTQSMIDILRAAAQRAGVLPLFDADATNPLQSATATEEQARPVGSASRPSPDAPAAPSPKQRWTKRASMAPNSDNPPRTGWRTVRRSNRVSPKKLEVSG